MRNTEVSADGRTPASCRLGFSTCVAVVIPPTVVEMEPIKSVALAPDGNPISRAIATALEVSMSKVRVDGKPYYAILAPGNPAAQVTVRIEAIGGKMTEAHTTEPRSSCNDSSSGGKMVSKCRSVAQSQVPCTQREASVSVTIRVFDGSGRLLTTRQNDGTGTSYLCQGDQGALLDHDGLLGAAAAQAFDAIVRELTVRTQTVKVLVREDAPEITDAERRQRFNEAVAFIKGGRLDRSCPVFQELSEIEGNSIAVLYNQAFCVQAKGDWCGANALYRRADALTHSPDAELATRIDETQQSCMARNS